ncbi:hypothetical protein BJ508DRAFT_307692 [Ascobolus immersus RN42]|uniref:Uncharacterized protein n=1 Tax=Ascobolus immersus RN42 TaxID=1160509 RepID=A0A3N4I1Z9_ASCIM|nr:hypothetical protein BJ508DRAFT_307692 [Ascobolus immersus RN42]
MARIVELVSDIKYFLLNKYLAFEHDLAVRFHKETRMEKFLRESREKKHNVLRREQKEEAARYGMFWEQYHTDPRCTKEPSPEVLQLISKSGLGLAQHLFSRDFERMTVNPHIFPYEPAMENAQWQCFNVAPNQLITTTISELTYSDGFPSERPSDHLPIRLFRLKAKSKAELGRLDVAKLFGIDLQSANVIYRGLDFGHGLDSLRNNIPHAFAYRYCYFAGSYATYSFPYAVHTALCGQEDIGAVVLIYRDVDMNGLKKVEYGEDNIEEWRTLTGCAVRNDPFEDIVEQVGQEAIDNWVNADLLVQPMIGNFAEVDAGGEPVAASETELFLRSGDEQDERLRNALCGVLIMELDEESLPEEIPRLRNSGQYFEEESTDEIQEII